MVKIRGKVGVIVQARMGSTRLKGKVLKKLSEKPVLLHVVNRLKYCKTVDDVIIATTNNEEDNIIADLCKKEGIKYYRGSESNVLDRYYQAAKLFDLDIIVRVTSDCPLIDPVAVDKVVNGFLNHDDVEYVSNSLIRSYPRGLECSAFSFQALEDSWEKASEPHHLEHVVLYIRENPDKYRHLNITNEEDLSKYRLTLDEPEDLELLTIVYDELYQPGKMIDNDEVIELIKNENLFNINSHIEQKSIK